MARTVKGLFFYAYVITDIFDKSIVGWAVHEEESGSHRRDNRNRQNQNARMDAEIASTGYPKLTNFNGMES